MCVKWEKGAFWAGQHSSPEGPEGPQEGVVRAEAVLRPQNTDPTALIHTQTDHQVQARWKREGGREVKKNEMGLSLYWNYGPIYTCC